MPLYPPSDPSLTFEPATLPEGFSENPVPREGPRPSFGQTLGAGFAIDNEVLGAIKAIDHETNFGDVDPNHNPWEQIQGTELEPYGDAFLGSRNQKNTDYIAGAIRDEIRNRRILEASHPLAAFAASGIASIASPTTLIPGGVVYRGLKIGRAAAKSALAVGAANAAAAGVQEAILHRQQYTRTGTESAFAVGGSFLLAALLGGAASGLSSRAFRNLTRKLETDLQISTALQNEVEAIKMGQAAQSAGAAAVAKPPADLKSAFGLEKLDLLGPSGRGMNSEFPSMRELTAETAELPTMTTRNDMGVTTAPRGGAIETRIKTQGDAKLGDAVTIADDAWKQYRFGKINPSFSERIGALGSKPPGKLTEKEFRQEMGKALVRNDEHQIPEIQKGVREIRKNVIQPIAEDAIKLKKLDVVEVTKNLPNWLKHELKPQPAAAAPKIDPNVRANLDAMLSRVEEMTGQTIDHKLRDQALAALAENEDLARRLREVFTGEPDIPFALRDRPVGRRLDDIVDDLENGHPVALDRDFTETMHGALRDVRHSLPDAARQVPVHYMVGVEPIGDGNVDVSFSGLDGGFFRLALPLDQFRVARAAEVNGVVLTFKSDFVGGVDQVLVGEVKHELAHALRRRGVIGDDVFNRLVSHSESLGVLDMPLRDFLAQTTGDATRVVGGESIRSAYTRIYMESNFSGAVIEAKLKEEAIAHMAELRAHGKLTDEQLGPVLADMDALFGRPVPAGHARAVAVADWIEQLRGAIKVDPDGGVMLAMRNGEKDVDRLGYFSGALRAARNLRQDKGTPEQMLAMLMKEGAKKNEIEATGVDKFILGRVTDAGAAGDGRPSATGAASAEGRTAGQRAANVSRNQITKSEIIKYLEDNRIEVREVERGLTQEQLAAESRMNELRDQMQAIQREDYAKTGGFRDEKVLAADYPEYAALVAEFDDLSARNFGPNRKANEPTKWSRYSLDPNNPTYRETVLHLPTSTELADQAIAALRQKYNIQPHEGWGKYATPEERAHIERLQDRAIEDDGRAQFRSGHFPEPNIVGHMMTSMVKHEGKATYLIDQIQDDWAQNIRDAIRNAYAKDMFAEQTADRAFKIEGFTPQFEQVRGWDDLNADQKAAVSKAIAADQKAGTLKGGVRDEAKIAELKKKFDGAAEKFDEKVKAVPRDEVVQTTSDYVYGRRFIFPSQLKGEFSDVARLAAELVTAEAATPGHPLVNTTDQWTNTTLRRAIRQAVEADAEYIAIPHGDTVLSYNPGQEGMLGFYGSRTEEGIVPKNLRKLLQKMDRNTPPPQRVEKLETSQGAQGWNSEEKYPFDKGNTGFTIVKLTDKVKQSVISDGQPMFALRNLDMSPEARKARAEELGFDTSRVWYHGTNREFKSFREADDGGNFSDLDVNVPEDGIWFTTESDRAGSFANAAAKTSARRGGNADGQNIVPVYLRYSNPYTYTAREYADEGISGAPSIFSLKRQGYDALVVERAEWGKYPELIRQGTDVAVFDPTNIRSVNAAFDPAKADSPNLMFALRDLSRRLDAPLVDDLKKSEPHPGRVMAVHGTKAQPFDQFDPAKSADFGIHFGTRDQADIPAGYTTTRENARMIPVVLDLKTVVDVPDMMTWPPVEVAQAVEKAYPLASGLTERVKRAIAQGTTETGPTGSERPSREALAAGKEELRRLMTEAKIDGLRYWNDSEGEGWSYIVWDEGKVTSATSGEPMMGVKPDGAPQFATAATNPVAEQPRFPDHAVRSVADQIEGATQQSASVSRSADGAVDAVRMGDSTYRVVRGEDGSVQGITVDPQGQLDFSAPVVDDAGITAIAKGIQAIVERAGGPPLDDAIVKGVIGDIVSAIGKGENPVQAVRTSLARVMPQMMLATRGDDILRVVRQLGGIRDETGDLAAMGAGERRGLISEQGLSPDAMRQHMIDRGFLQDVPYEDVTQSSVNDLYDLIREALGDQSGGKRVYREEMAHQALKAVQKIIDDNGLEIKLTPDQEDQLVRMILDQRLSPDDAVERLGMMGEDVKSSAQQNTDPMRDINARRIMQDISDLMDDGSRDDVFSSEVADEVWGDGAESYGPRVWDRPRVIAKRPDVKGIITDYFQEAQGRAQGLLSRMMRDMKKLEADAVVAGKPPKIPADMVKDIEGLQHFTSLSRMDLESTADQVIDHILGLQDGRMMMELPKAVRGSLKARTLRIPDLFESANGRIEDFFDRDINVMMRQYVRSTVPDLEIVRRFGKLTLEDQFARIGDDFKRMVERLNLTSEQRASMTPDQIAKHDIMAERERKRLDKARRNAERDLTGMISRLRGERMDHMDPTAISTRTLRGFRQWNLITMLGGMTVSAIPDIFRPMMVHGVKSYFMDGLRPLLTNISAVKKAGSEVKTFGTALDLELGTRLHAFSDVVDDYGRYSKFERGLGYATEKFGVMSLMNGWNASLKRVAGMMAMTNAVRMAQKVANGTATKADIRTLAAAGIDAFDARTVAQQFATHGAIEGGVYLPNSKSWDVSDPNVRMALDSFKGAIVRDVDRSIVTPGQEKPLFMSTEVGATLLQFKTFGFASFQRTLIAGLQQRDSGVLLGAVLSVGMGMAVEHLKALMNDKPLPKTEAQWIAAGLDRSGLLAYISDANNLLEKGSGGTLGIGALTGKELSRYASRNAMDALMGPSVGRGADIFAVTSGFSRALAGKDQVRESDIATFRRLIPFQNLFYLSYIFQKLEQAVSKGIGAKPSKHRSPLMDRLSLNDNWLDELVSVG